MSLRLKPLLAAGLLLVAGCADHGKAAPDRVGRRGNDGRTEDVSPAPGDLSAGDAPGENNSPPGDDLETNGGELTPGPSVRIPGEWEPQAATWMQWPTKWESSMRPDFSRVIGVVQVYQPVHLLVLDAGLEEDARTQISAAGGDPDGVTYHLIDYDNSWLRDNGPVFAMRDSGLEIQDWGFDGWGGNFGTDIPFQADDSVPAALCQDLHLPCQDYNDYVLERGNLEVNGNGTVVLGWDCQLDRNPGWDMDATEALLEARLGATRVLWVHGHDPQDLTTGHIDGLVRFVDETRAAVARSLIPGDPNAEIMDNAAESLGNAGLEIVRMDVPGTVSYKGEEMPAIYMNWLVGNGFVAAMAFGKPEWDQAAGETLEGLFPGRDVHLVETLELWSNGGGIHCITNDQPAWP